MRLILLLLLIISVNVWAQDNLDTQKSELSKIADASCIAIKPIGICPKAKHVVGVLVLLREPSLIVETINKGGGNLQFHDVRVFDNPIASSFHQ